VASFAAWGRPAPSSFETRVLEMKKEYTHTRMRHTYTKQRQVYLLQSIYTLWLYRDQRVS
jgi:hypothetical protein